MKALSQVFGMSDRAWRRRPPEKFAAFIQAETATWTKVTREAGVTVGVRKCL
jgi:hypothetical protein